MRNEFFKYGEEVLTQTLQTFFKTIFDSEDIPRQRKISMLIKIDKEKQDSKKLEKRGISLRSNISKLFEKIIVNRLNKHPKFTEAQAGARRQKSLFTLKSIIQQRKHEWKDVRLFRSRVRP